MQRLKLGVGNLVMVSEFRPDGTPHPHAGKTGVITRLLDPSEEERDNLSSEEPRFGMMKLDDGIPPKNFICVSLECLEGYKLTHVMQHDWRTMNDEEFAEWLRNLKLKALDATESERTRQARAKHELQPNIEFRASPLGDSADASRADFIRRKGPMTEGRREPKKCSFCGRLEGHPASPMFSSASASICLSCIKAYCLPYLRETEQRRVLHQAQVLWIPASRWNRKAR